MLTRYARYCRQVLGEQVLAELREDFVENTLALPVGTVESAGSGDLLTRTSRDVDQLGWSVRWALPEWTIAVVTAVLTFAAALSVGWWVALPCLLGVPPLVIGLRWYLARAKDGYLRENATYSVINATLTETIEGARTIETLGLGDERIAHDRRGHRGLLRRGEVHPLPAHGVLPVDGDRLPAADRGDPAVRRLPLHPGQVGLGEVTAATLYVQMLIDPVDRVVAILDELQVGAASLARLLGVAQVPDDRDGHRRPAGRREDRRRRRPVRLRRGARRAARHRPRRSGSASGSRWSAPPAPGSPRSAGCSPASTRPAPAR